MARLALTGLDQGQSVVVAAFKGVRFQLRGFLKLQDSATGLLMLRKPGSQGAVGAGRRSCLSGARHCRWSVAFCAGSGLPEGGCEQ
jgi:hypothetical protein